MKSLFALLVVVGAGLAGCSYVLGPLVEGSGTVATETRELSPFESVSFAGSGDLVLKIQDQSEVTLTYDDNLLPLVKTDVIDGGLSIHSEGRISSPNRLQIEVQTAELTQISVAGSGDIEIPSAELDSLDVQIAGSGSVHAEGSADSVEIRIAGSGDVDLRDFQVKTAKVQITGSGDVTIYATDTVDVEIMGSGDVEVHGPAKVTQSVMGSGDVILVDPPSGTESAASESPSADSAASDAAEPQTSATQSSETQSTETQSSDLQLKSEGVDDSDRTSEPVNN